MNVDELAAEMAYMMAHVRLNAKNSYVGCWSPQEIKECFNVLPTPQVDFNTWCMKMDISITSYEQQANSAAINSLKTMAHPAVKIDEAA